MENHFRSDIKLVETPKKPLSMNPKKFGLWLFIASVTMLFAAWTSAYIVRRAEGNWLYFDLPKISYLTVFVIVLSSLTIQWAYVVAAKNQFKRLKISLLVTAVFGIIFLIGQLLTFQALVQSNIYLVGNPSGSFFYIISGFHALHIVSALVFLFFVGISTAKRRIHSQNLAQLEMCVTYWHFLGFLWVYLFVFFLVNR